MDDTSSRKKAYAAWQAHMSGPRENTEQFILSSLRDAYPNHAIIRANPKDCDLLGYASKGLATATLEEAPFSDTYRTYQTPRFRLQENGDGLHDTVDFGRYSYVWNDKQFFVYKGRTELSYTSNRFRTFQFILRRRGDDEGDSNDCGGGHDEGIDALLLTVGRWTKEFHDEILVFDDQNWTKTRELWESVQGSTWDDVILDPGMKANLIGDVEGFFENQHVYKSFGIPWKRGVIFHGVPGNGKTASLKALINTLQTREDPIPSLYVKSLDGCYGPKWCIRSIFEKARAMAPCLLIFEDLDSMVTKKTRSYFLNEVDGLESNDGILMIGSTNHLEKLDTAITERPSRFDRKYHFKIPDLNQREAYCRYWRGKMPAAAEIEFPDDICALVAEMTDDFSFAYLKELFMSSFLILSRKEAGQSSSDGMENGVKQDTVDGGSAADQIVIERPKKGEAAKPGKAKGGFAPWLRLRALFSGPRKAESNMSTAIVKVPVHLRGNQLLGIIAKQVCVLVGEMDNSMRGEKNDSSPRYPFNRYEEDEDEED